MFGGASCTLQGLYGLADQAHAGSSGSSLLYLKLSRSGAESVLHVTRLAHARDPSSPAAAGVRQDLISPGARFAHAACVVEGEAQGRPCRFLIIQGGCVLQDLEKDLNRRQQMDMAEGDGHVSVAAARDFYVLNLDDLRHGWKRFALEGNDGFGTWRTTTRQRLGSRLLARHMLAVVTAFLCYCACMFCDT